MTIRKLSTNSPEFDQQLDDLLAWSSVSDATVAKTVEEILSHVRERGDVAVVEYTNQFDHRKVSSIDELLVSPEELSQALEDLPVDQRNALEVAAVRVRDYHTRQVQASWQFTEEDGTVLGQKVTAMDRVGLYVPGGKASYPSSVLMNAIPAKVAGVEEIIMVVPAPSGELSPMVLAAAAIAGVDKVYTVGGAQAVAALAYGTESIAKVDKIVGPG
ncbi:MAG: histidinol dehydrogenase, partial [Oceanicoccus sp.]